MCIEEKLFSRRNAERFMENITAVNDLTVDLPADANAQLTARHEITLHEDILATEAAEV
jgi:hypothetical protein